MVEKNLFVLKLNDDFRWVLYILMILMLTDEISMILYSYLMDGQLTEDLIDMENRICNIEEYIELYKYNIAMELLERLTHLNEIKTQVEMMMTMLFARIVSHVHQL